MTDSTVQIQFGGDTSRLETSINSVTASLQSLTSPIEGLKDSFVGLGEAAVAAFAIDGIVEFTEKFADLGERINRTSLILGISTDQVQQLNFAIRMGGGDAETAAVTMGIFEKNIAEAASGTGKAADAFQNMGISVTKANGDTRSAIEILGDLADVLSHVQDANIRAEYGRALFGRGFQNLLPVILEGKDGLQQLNDVLDKTSSKLSNEQVKALEESARKTKELSASWDGLLIELGSDTAWTHIKQDLIDITQYMTGFAKSIGQATHAFAEFVGLADKEIKPTALNEFDAAANQFKAAMGEGVKNYGQLFGPNLPAIKLAPLKEPGADREDNSEEKNQIAIERSNLETQLQLNRLSVQSRKDADDAKVASGEISKARELADLRDFASQEWELNMETLDKEMALWDKDTAEYTALLNKKRILTAQYNNDIARLTAQSVVQQKHQYDEIFNGIKSAMDGMVSGILQGTQTWHQAMIRFADNIGIKFAQLAANSVLDWVKSELLKTNITETQTAVRTAAQAAGDNATNALGAVKIIKSIESSAAETYAGVFGFLSPVMGPLAAGPAAVAAGTVGALTGLVSLDVGAWNLNQDMVAQLHQGEMVIPKDFASGLRSGGSFDRPSNSSNANGFGGNGDTVIINGPLVQAIDTKTGTDFLLKNAATIAKAISAEIRNGNRSLMGTMRG